MRRPSYATLCALGFAFGLVVIAGGIALLTGGTNPREVSVEVRSPDLDPEALRPAEAKAFGDCKVPDEWPKGVIPTSALVRAKDGGPATRVSFDSAWHSAEDGTAWLVALCHGGA